MTVKKQMDSLVDLAGRMGELVGTSQAVLSELSRLNGELIRLGNELDKKHEENIKRIEERHQHNTALLSEHKDEDSRNFAKIFKWMNYVSGAFGLTVILWSIVKLVLPLFLNIKLGE